MNTYISLLKQFVAFKSISTDPKYKDEMVKTAEWLKDLLENNGFEATLWTEFDTNPLLSAEYKVNDNAKTVLVYGHYDVQPAPEEGWNSDPFELTELDGRLYARGVVDNKGQVLIHIATIIDLIKEKKLKYNVKFLIEGDEETGAGLDEVIKAKKEELKTDYVLVSDGEITGTNPTLETSFRGGFNVTLEYKTGKTNLHSGLYGSAVPNAVHELSDFISKIHKDQKIQIPGFYEGVDEITQKDLGNNNTLLETYGKNPNAEIAKIAGVKQLKTQKDTDFFSQTGLLPAIQVTGITGGYTEEGYANIVPYKATAKFNVRLVTSQKPDKIVSLMKAFVKENTPEYVEYKLDFFGIHDPVKLNTTLPIFAETEKILHNVYGTKVIYKNVGGAIPFIGDIKNILGVDTLSVSLANEDCNMHGDNENFRLDLVEKALKFSREFFSAEDYK